MNFNRNIFEIVKANVWSNEAIGSIWINKHAELFLEHFPAFPVLPGAFILGISKAFDLSVFEENYGFICELKKVKKISFLKIINPDNCEIINVKNQYEKKDNSIISKISLMDSRGDVMSKGILEYRLIGRLE